MVGEGPFGQQTERGQEGLPTSQCLEHLEYDFGAEKMFEIEDEPGKNEGADEMTEHLALQAQGIPLLQNQSFEGVQSPSLGSNGLRREDLVQKYADKEQFFCFFCLKKKVPRVSKGQKLNPFSENLFFEGKNSKPSQTFG